MNRIDRRVPFKYFFAIGIIAAATIFCEITLTRLFSVVQYYHGAFLAISLALFGFAASGVYVFLRSKALGIDELDGALARYGLLFTVSIPVGLYSYLYVGSRQVFESIGLGAQSVTLGAAVEYILLALPFFASGTCLSLLLRHGADQANRLYAVDLMASASGAVLVIPSLVFFGGPKSVLVASALALAGSAPFLRAWAWGRPCGFVLAAAILAGGILIPSEYFEEMRLRKPPLFVATESIRWNAFSMVGVGPEINVPYEVDEYGKVASYRARQIVIDNSVVTEMVAFNGDLSKIGFLKDDNTAIVHRLRPNGSTLIIGSGGGRDILVALANGQQDIQAVEVNPLVVRLADEDFREFTGQVYSRQGVQKVVGDARSYIANSSESFDVILATLIDTWAASAAGAFALTENLLYTTGAFRDYYDHLSDDGILSIARWHPLETPRLLSTGLEAWRLAGVEDPRRHAMFLVTPPHPGLGRISLLMLKKTPFTPEEIRTVEAFAAEKKITLALSPGAVRDPVVAHYLEIKAGAAAKGAWAAVDLSPASDDRPFFFNMVRPSTQLARIFGLLPHTDRALGGFQPNLQATDMLVKLFGMVVVLVLLAIVIPVAVRVRSAPHPNWLALFGYFGCVGLGYMLIEIGLLQRLILLLGQPVYSLAVILSTMLLASGLGSFASSRIATDQLPRRLPVLVVAAALLLALYAVFLPGLIRGLLGAPFAVRIAISVLIVALPAFLMGMPFPCGLRMLDHQDRDALVPWVWAINGAMSVIASVGAILLAIQFGYVVVFATGTVCYFAAGLLFRRWAVAAPQS